MRVLDCCKSITQNCDAFGAFLQSWQFSTMSQEKFRIPKNLKIQTLLNPVSVSGIYVHVIRYLAALCSRSSTASAIG